MFSLTKAIACSTTAAALATTSSVASADDELGSPRWTIQIDPLTTALGFVHVQVECALSPDLSLYLGPRLNLFPGILGEPNDVDFIGLRV